MNISDQSNYKKQQNLALAQFLAETPSFVAVLVSAILSRAILVFVDLMDSLGNLLRAAMVTVLSGKLTKNLRYEYNYGIGKIEAIASLLCDGLVFLGLIMTFCISVYSIIFPEQPSDLVIAVVGLKVVNVSFDIAFYVKQRKIAKTLHSAISETNCAAALGALLFDSVTLISLLAMWLLRNYHIGGYISPVISILISIYLMVGCIKRIKAALSELMDRTLPEELQMKILNILLRFYNSYSQVESINSRKVGELIRIDLHLSFESNTSYKEIVELKNKMQVEFEEQIENCTVNIIIGND